jgi:hypothetical protein
MLRIRPLSAAALNGLASSLADAGAKMKLNEAVALAQKVRQQALVR